jgi:quercetin dioxygenase-like cupin family protein
VSDIYLVNIDDVPGRSPQRPEGMETSAAVTRFLGESDEAGPWVYFTERPKGDVVPFHKHASDRLEFLIEGEIDWRERGGESRRYGAGTLSFVVANKVYGYRVLQDAKILIWFLKRPGMNYM